LPPARGSAALGDQHLFAYRLGLDLGQNSGSPCPRAVCNFVRASSLIIILLTI
jgi:hypothetical protein